MQSLKTNPIRLISWLLPVLYLLIFIPQINNQIAPNNHNLIITLTTIENWMEEGASNHNFNLIHSWGNPGDLNVHYYKRVMNDEGRNYFVSYPPFATILIYPFLELFPRDYLPLGFKLFGIIIHILTYIALLALFRDKSPFQKVFGAAVFLFFPASIVLSGMYYPEQLVLFLAVLFAVVIQFKKSPIWVALLSFLLIYTDWLGGLIIASVLLMKILSKGDVPLVYLLCGAIAGGGLLFVQYASINGIDGLFHGLKVRYLERAGLFPQEYSDRGVNLISGESINYIKDHLLHTSIAIIFILWLLKPKMQLSSNLLWIITLPILIHLLVLFNSNILHYQNLSKLGLFFALIGANISKSGWIKWGAGAIMIIVGYLAVNSYWSEYDVDEDLYTQAEFIKSHNDPQKVLLIKQGEFSENLVILSYLTKRNLTWSNSEKRTRQILNATQQEEYILLDSKSKRVISGSILNP